MPTFSQYGAHLHDVIFCWSTWRKADFKCKRQWRTGVWNGQKEAVLFPGPSALACSQTNYYTGNNVHFLTVVSVLLFFKGKIIECPNWHSHLVAESEFGTRAPDSPHCERGGRLIIPSSPFSFSTSLCACQTMVNFQCWGRWEEKANGVMWGKDGLATTELKAERMRVARPTQISLFVVCEDVTRPEKPEQKTVAALFCWTEARMYFLHHLFLWPPELH